MPQCSKPSARSTGSRWYTSGALKPRIGGEWPLEGVGEALTKITAGETTGKLLLRV